MYYGELVIHEAARHGRVDEVEQLLHDHDVDIRDRYGNTPLMWASRAGHPDVMKLLASRGANVNAANDEGWTALMFAAKEGHAEAVCLLIDLGADVKAKSKFGFTPLALAEDPEVVKLLGGADALAISLAHAAREVIEDFTGMLPGHLRLSEVGTMKRILRLALGIALGLGYEEKDEEAML